MSIMDRCFDTPPPNRLLRAFGRPALPSEGQIWARAVLNAAPAHKGAPAAHMAADVRVVRAMWADEDCNGEEVTAWLHARRLEIDNA